MKSLVFAVSFLMAFLLFVVQPMATKLVLPTLGGSPAVWNTAMLIFQMLLLAGYLYAYTLTRYLPQRAQLAAHALLIITSFFLLPISVVLQSSDAVINHPILAMSKALLSQLGLPFFVLSATAPLLQSWVSKSQTPLARTPYVLYSASNLGSFMALIGYVLVIEPIFDLGHQRNLWSVLYVIGVIPLLAIGYWLLQNPVSAGAVAESPSEESPFNARRAFTWIGLAFLPSALSLSVTSHLTTDIAVVPLLWVVPLAIYLLSFVDAFSTKPVLVPFAMRVAPVIGLIALLIYSSPLGRNALALVWHLLAFTFLAFALHGHLARAKPGSRHLTLFYLCLSVGGALGGVLNAIVAPLLFTDTLEYPLTLAAASLCAFIYMQWDSITLNSQLKTFARLGSMVCAFTAFFYVLIATTISQQSFNPLILLIAAFLAGAVLILTQRRWTTVFWALAAINMLLIGALLFQGNDQQTLFKARNFFGVQKVTESSNNHARYFMHNTTLHGVQSLNPANALKPTAYYSALIEAFQSLPIMHTQPMAVVGLGVGTISCYAGPHQPVDLIDINPLVVKIAQNPHYFTYLRDCPGIHRILLGDGRIKMGEKENQRYGTVIMDVFSSDSIPTHLLTREAFATYVKKLAPHGVLLIHTTNRHMDLWPLIATQARALGWVAYGKHFTPPKTEPLVYDSFWTIMATTQQDIAPLLQANDGWQKLVAPDNARVWTDQYMNILPYLRERSPSQ